MNKKALTILTIAAMLMSLFLLASSIYLPTSDAPEVNLTLHDTDGVKTVSVGETAEYLILVENEGSTNGHIEFSREGDASGWESTLSHESLNLHPGDSQLVSLFVTPTDEDAAPSIDVNVVATRGDNVTVVHTTTYLDGTVLIRKAGETDWTPFTKDSEIGEGDDLRTEADSRVQVLFQHVALVLFPTSEVHITHMNILGEDASYNFHLVQGKVGFYVFLPTIDSALTLSTENGGGVKSSSTSQMIFEIDSDGKMLVFLGTVPYYPPPTRQAGTDVPVNISQGFDSSGVRFNYAELKYDNDVVSGILKNAKDETIGFDNTGDFVGSGDIDGFVLRLSDMDMFYVFGLDMETLDLEITKVKPGEFDLSFSRFSPDEDDEVHLRGFVFEDMNAPSDGTILFVFKLDEVTLSTDARLTYDFGARYKETQRFYLNDMYTEAGQGNSFEVLNYVHLQNEEVNTVLIGRDKDNDGSFEDEIVIHTGMTGEQVYDDLDDEDEGPGYYILIAVIIIILIIVGMYFIIQSGPGGFGLGTETEGSEDVREKMHPGFDDEIDSTLPPPASEEPDEGDHLTDDDLDELPGSDDEAPMEDDLPLPPIAPVPLEEEPENVMAEELMERKKEMLLEEEYDTIAELPPELLPVHSDNPFSLPHEDVHPPRLFIYPAAPDVPEDKYDIVSRTEPEEVPPEPEFEPYESEEIEPQIPEPIPMLLSEDLDVQFSLPHENAAPPRLFIYPLPVEPSDEDEGLQIRYDDEGYVDLDLDLFPEDEETITPPPLTSDGEIWKKGTQGEPSDPAEKKRIVTREDVLESLQKVKGQKEEMETIEPETEDDGWWETWNEEMKRDIESLESSEE